MPTVEERLARLEEHRLSVDEKTGVLFDKLEEVVDQIKELVKALSTIEVEHATCIRMRSDTAGWIKGRFTKIFDACLAGGLIYLLILLLKNPATLLALLGGGK